MFLMLKKAQQSFSRVSKQRFMSPFLFSNEQFLSTMALERIDAIYFISCKYKTMNMLQKEPLDIGHNDVFEHFCIMLTLKFKCSQVKSCNGILLSDTKLVKMKGVKCFNQFSDNFVWIGYTQDFQNKRGCVSMQGSES